MMTQVVFLCRNKLLFHDNLSMPSNAYLDQNKEMEVSLCHWWIFYMCEYFVEIVIGPSRAHTPVVILFRLEDDI